MLVEQDKALRTYGDLPVIDQDIRRLGVGGRLMPKSDELDQLLPESDIKVSELVNNLDRLAREIKFERISYETIYDAFKNRSDQIQSTPSIRPVIPVLSMTVLVTGEIRLPVGESSIMV